MRPSNQWVRKLWLAGEGEESRHAKVADGIVKQIQLDAMKEGARRAALYADDTTEARARTTIQRKAESWTELDLYVS